MRSADTLVRLGLSSVLCTLAAGCASVTEHLPASLQNGVNVLVSAPAPAASDPTASAPPPAPMPVAAETEPAVSATAQRAFDQARRSLRAGRADEAERGFRALVQSNPELGGPHANLGLILRQSGKLPEAVAELEQAVRLSPKQPLYFNQLGVTYRLNGQFTKARDAYEAAIALDAGYAAAHLNLGILQDLYLLDGKRALEHYDRYLALSPGGDAAVTKWVADLKNRKQQVSLLNRKEKE